MLEAKHISKNIGKRAILYNCSLMLEPGRFTAIVGPNGAGKSTLLKALTGEDKSISGEVIINGRALKTFNSKDLSRVRAIMPQHSTINFPFTVEQVVEIGRYPHKSSAAENEKIVSMALATTKLESFRHRRYVTLSGGEKQRVQMARMVAQLWGKIPDPKYLLLDEPTSSLDLSQQHYLLSLSRGLLKENIGVMAILHDLNLALQYADDILFLKNGETMEYGPIGKVLTKEIVEATFDYPVELIKTSSGTLISPVSPNYAQKIDGTSEINELLKAANNY